MCDWSCNKAYPIPIISALHPKPNSSRALVAGVGVTNILLFVWGSRLGVWGLGLKGLGLGPYLRHFSPGNLFRDEDSGEP